MEYFSIAIVPGTTFYVNIVEEKPGCGLHVCRSGIFGVPVLVTTSHPFE
jgi:hypothetical protein